MSETSRDAEFRAFVAARSRALLRTAYLLTGDVHHAEDLVQTALTKVYLAQRRIRHTGAMESYTRTVLLNTYLSWWRRRSWREAPVDDAEAVGPAVSARDDITAYVERDAMWQRLRALPRQQRAVLVLRFYEDRSVEEAARLLGLSTGTVKSHTHRALASLRGRLADDASPVTDEDRPEPPVATTTVAPAKAPPTGTKETP